MKHPQNSGVAEKQRKAGSSKVVEAQLGDSAVTHLLGANGL